MTWILKLKFILTRKKFDKSFGVVVFRTDCLPNRVLLIQNPAGFWGFPKGHMEKGEAPIESAKRELFEETGVVCEPLPEPVFITDRVYEKHGSHTHKTFYFFLSFLNYEPKVEIQKDEIKDFKWATFEEANVLLDTVGFPKLKNCFGEILEYIKKETKN